MPEEVSKNPLIRALRFVLEENARLLVLDYSDPGDFGRLWRFESFGAKQLLIVWPRTAPDAELDPIDAGECLSPVDWAVCYATRNGGKPEDWKPNDWPEVLILDLNPELHERFDSVAHLSALKTDQLPWLRVVPGAELSSITGWLANPLDRDGDRFKGALTRFLREIKLNLTEVKSEGANLAGPKSDGGYNRHAIANLIGPMILRGKPAEKFKRSWHAFALLRLLQACGLVPSSVTVDDFLPDASGTESTGGPGVPGVKDQDEQAWPDWVTGEVTDPAIQRTGEGLAVLLVDDQAEHGWADWVKESLPGVTLAVLKDPTPLVREVERQLQKAKTADPTAKDLRFRLQFPGLSEGKTPILLLDLRLFSGKPDSEQAFYKDTLLPLMVHFTNREDCAWPGFTENERKAADDWCKKPKRDSEGYLEILSLLPRLLALVDVSIPIVMFSSTNQRRIIELVKPYGTIITKFDKPHVNSMVSVDVVDEAKSRFLEAINGAAGIARAAQLIRKVSALPLTQYDGARRLFEGKKHIEIFHDESGNVNSPYFRVAAFAVGFQSEISADRIDNYIKNNGPRFFGTKKLEQIKGDRPIEDARNQWNNDIAPALVNAFNSVNIEVPYLIPFVVVLGDRVESSPDDDPYALLDPTGLDNTNQELLRLLFEVMIVDTLAWVSDTVYSKCCIYAATRMRHRATEIEPKKKAMMDALLARWQINLDPERQLRIEKQKSGKWASQWQSLRRDSLHSLLNDLMAGRNNSKKGMAFAKSIFKGYCTPIPRDNYWIAADGYRFLHSIADPIVRLVDKDDNCVTWRNIESNKMLALPLRGAAGTRARIIMMLNCHRALDEGDLVDGFGYGLRINHEHDVAGNVVAWRLRSLIPCLNGENFLRIVRHVADGGPQWTHSPRLQGERSSVTGPLRISSVPAKRSKHGPNDQHPKLERRWKVKRFENVRAYKESGETWHEQKGFLVRLTCSKRVYVFADLSVVGQQLLPGFDEPVTPSLFLNGAPCGRPLPFLAKTQERPASPQSERKPHYE